MKLMIVALRLTGILWCFHVPTLCVRACVCWGEAVLILYNPEVIGVVVGVGEHEGQVLMMFKHAAVITPFYYAVSS